MVPAAGGRAHSWRSSRPAVYDAREVEVAVIGNEEPKASVPGEIKQGHDFYDYAAKYADDETELMIFVTPHLVRPMLPEEVPFPPGTTENYNPNDFELFLLGLDHSPGSRTAEPTGPIGFER